MPTEVKVQSRKFFNQIENGSDFSLNTSNFTTYFQGNAGGKYKAAHEVTVEWYAFASSGNRFSYRAADNKIVRQYGSWIEDGFSVNDEIRIVSGSNTSTGDATITNINDLEITIDSGDQVLVDELDTASIVVGRTSLDECEFTYNLIGNDESTNFLSKIDGNEMKFTGSGLTASLSSLTPSGVPKSWQNGQVEVKTLSSYTTFLSNTDQETSPTTRTFTGTAQGFLIEHEFILAPLYLDGEQSNIDSVNPPERFATSNCLKYVFKFNGSQNIQNPNVKHEASVDDSLGNTGYINENFNGALSDYAITSVSYTDKSTGTAVDGLQLNSSTTVNAVISGSNFSSGDAFVINHQALQPEDDYRGESVIDDTYVSNIVYENFRGTMDAASASGDMIENVVVTVDSPTQITAVFDVNFGSSQKAKLSTSKNFFLGFLISDDALASASSNEVMLKIDSQLYSKGIYGDDVAGLISFGSFKMYQHPEDDDVSSDGFTNIEAYVQDKVLTEFDFTLDWSGTNQPFIESFTPRLVAYNATTGESFDLQSESYNLSQYPMAYNATLGGTVQQINLNTTRGFLLADDDDFNKVSVQVYDGSATQATYKVKWAFAFNWQDYRKLSRANSIFFDSSELNNGLNLDSAHYSENAGASDWGVYLFFDFDVAKSGAGSAVTLYRLKSDEIPVFKQGEFTDSPNPWTVTKRLTDQSGTNTGNNILDNQNTKVFFEFVDSRGDVGGSFHAVVRLEEYQNGGLLKIHELSSWIPSAENNILQPLAGESYAKITKSPADTLTVECEIKKDLIEIGKQYDVTCRIFTGLSETKLFEDGSAFLFEDTDPYKFE